MKFISSIFQLIISFFRMAFVGASTAVILLYSLDLFLDTDNGVLNLIIIIMAYSFFPLFFAILVEVFYKERRKNIKNKKMIKQMYKNT